MSASERLPRLLALVPWLAAHDGITISDAADHFGISPEQLTKDLWQLVVCGVPGYGPDQLVDIQFWDDDVIHVLDPQTLSRPMRLTFEEGMALLVALRVLAQAPGVDDRGAILSAAAKIEQALAVDSAAVAIDMRVDGEVRSAVDDALASGQGLVIRYAAASDDEITERTILPRDLLVIDGIAYLEAYCTLAAGRRTFRLDRMLAAAVVPAPVEGEAAGDAEAPLLPPTPPTSADIVVTPEARWIVDVHNGTIVGEAPDGGTVVRIPLHSHDWAVRLVLSLRGSARVVGPPELATAVAAAATDALRAYPVA